MPRVIFYTATTLNGFLADDADSLDWLFAVPGGEGGDSGFQEFLAGIGVLVQGSSTYEWVLRQEDLLAHPEKWPAYYGARPTFVFTRRDLPSVAGADIRFAHGHVLAAWPQIREAAGDRDVWVVGGGDLAGQFADAGLLDEILVSVAPATLASGKPLLPRRMGADRLTLTRVRQAGAFAELTYAVTGGGSRASADDPAVSDG
ncbi:dihydrofolate reductase family protein [Microbacterium sp. Root180]|uniref:dihydrofolate reductase family protein n=1 Tax=Microbacterium sp. Root180 TaxID=1736483 RepID=UPI0006F232A5|nr:dihydrofolate reductase family protein [Microbacterium sp. Root180]KRB37898.1 deaminase [Microbacterium sp. Root180]